ncbi:MAG: MBL fold metallo-hydrolase [Prevotella sp.]
MKLTFLGTGTSCGVPVIGCQCDVCRSTDPHDKRFRCSALVETDTTRLLIDCGPDFRQQILTQPFRKIDGILITHHHYDHVGGMDDLRPYCRFGDIEVFADETSARNIRHNMPYCFVENKYPGVPSIILNEIHPHEPFQIGDLNIMPFTVMHGALPILAYRITYATPNTEGQGGLTYITDMKTIAPTELPYAVGSNVLVVNALRFTKSHHSHMLVDEALQFISSTNIPQTYLIHSCHDIGLHDEANRRLPRGVQLAYDGLEVSLT